MALEEITVVHDAEEPGGADLSRQAAELRHIGMEQNLCRKTTPFFFSLNISYVCPEPVLVNRASSVSNGAKNGVSRTHAGEQQVAIQHRDIGERPTAEEPPRRAARRLLEELAGGAGGRVVVRQTVRPCTKRHSFP